MKIYTISKNGLPVWKLKFNLFKPSPYKISKCDKCGEKIDNKPKEGWLGFF